MKISALRKIIQDKAKKNVGDTDYDPQVKALVAFLDIISASNEGAAVEPNISFDDYLDFASEYLHKPRTHILDYTYLHSAFSDVSVFKEWMKIETFIPPKRDIATAEQEIAKPHKLKLDNWLKKSQEELAKFNLEAVFQSTYNQATPIEVLNEKLEELVSKRTDLPKKANREQIYQNERHEAEIKHITHLIAWQNANRMIEDYAVLKAKHPDTDVDIDFYMLKRHEVSKNVHKGFGLRKDTGLTALDASMLTDQTKHHLEVSQMVHSAFAEALKAAGLISYVKQSISPIRRAWQTAVKAVFTSNIPDETEINSDYGETKHGFLPRNLARSSETDKSSGPAALKAGVAGIFKKLTIDDNAFDDIKSDEKSQWDRVRGAVYRFFGGAPSQHTEGNTFHVLVAHGGVVGDMVKQFDKESREAEVPSSIPPGKVKMDYGDFKMLLIARDKQGKMLEIAGGGSFTRSGIERSAVMQLKEFHSDADALMTAKAKVDQAIANVNKAQRKQIAAIFAQKGVSKANKHLAKAIKQAQAAEAKYVEVHSEIVKPHSLVTAYNRTTATPNKKDLGKKPTLPKAIVEIEFLLSKHHPKKPSKLKDFFKQRGGTEPLTLKSRQEALLELGNKVTAALKDPNLHGYLPLLQKLDKQITYMKSTPAMKKAPEAVVKAEQVVQQSVTLRR